MLSSVNGQLRVNIKIETLIIDCAFKKVAYLPLENLRTTQGMQRLTKVEADKVYQIIKNSTDKLDLLAHIPSTCDDEYISDLETDTLISSLKRLWTYEEGLSKIETTSALFDSNDISLLRNTHKSVRSVCRQVNNERTILLEKPNLSSPEFRELLNNFKLFKDHLYNKLNMTVEDEENNRNILLELGDKTRLLEETKRILESKVKEMEFQRETQLKEYDETKSKLEADLHELAANNSADCNLVQKELAESIIQANHEHTMKKTQLTEQLVTVERTVTEIIQKNHEEELKLRKDKNKIEHILSEKINEYNNIMSMKRDELNTIQQNYQSELNEYNRLKAYFDDVDAQIAKRNHELAILQVRRQKEDYVTNLMYNAVAVLQKWVRGKQARAVYAKMKAKKQTKKKTKK